MPVRATSIGIGVLGRASGAADSAVALGGGGFPNGGRRGALSTDAPLSSPGGAGGLGRVGAMPIRVCDRSRVLRGASSPEGGAAPGMGSSGGAIPSSVCESRGERAPVGRVVSDAAGGAWTTAGGGSAVLPQSVSISSVEGGVDGSVLWRDGTDEARS